MLTVIIGPMFAGKSVELIRQVNRHKIAGRRVVVFKYGADNRYSQTSAASYDGLTTWAIPVATADDVKSRVEPEHEVVVIDEIQFFDDPIIELLLEYVKEGKEVIVAGLNLDFRAKPFIFAGGARTMADLVVHGDAIHALQAICTARDQGKTCGALATRTQRLTNGKPASAEDPVVQIGSVESYEARCIRHHIVPQTPL